MNPQSIKLIRFAILIIVMTLCACSPKTEPLSVATPLPTFETERELKAVDCPFPSPPQYEVTCAEFEVPVDYGDPYGEKFILMSAVIHSASLTPAPDPVFILNFGLGGEMLNYVQYFGEIYNSYLDQHDLVFFDLRGSGYSSQAFNLDCPEVAAAYVENFKEALEPAEETRLAVDAYKTCRERLVNMGVRIPTISSAQIAGDINTIRLGLGYEQINLVASNFGSLLAQSLLRDHPETIRSVIYDYYISPLTAQDVTSSFQHALELVFQWCERDGECSAAYPELETRFYTIINSLNETPVEVEVKHPEGPEYIKVKVTGSRFVFLIQNLLYTADTSAKIPRILDDASNGKFYRLAEDIEFNLMFSYFDNEGLSTSIECNDFFTDKPVGSRTDVNPTLRQIFEEDFALESQICEVWLGTEFKPPQRPLTSGNTPVLLFTYANDPVFAPSLAEETVRGMSNNLVINFPTTQAIWTRMCAQELTLAFLEKPGKTIDTQCAEREVDFKFVIPMK
jgi:pimeloyl-ACP methyl ester carboxylesterase